MHDIESKDGQAMQPEERNPSPWSPCVPLDELPVPSCFINSSLIIEWANTHFSDLLNTTIEQLVGKSIKRFLDANGSLALQRVLSHPSGHSLKSAYRTQLEDSEGRFHDVLIHLLRIETKTCVTVLPHSDGFAARGQTGAHNLSDVSAEFMQTEKLAAIGQLAAGVAHEINNPIGYVYSNLRTLAGYLADLRQIIDAIDHVADLDALQQLKKTLDYDFIRNDVSDLLSESAEGIERVKHIISALKDFSRKDEMRLQQVDLHNAIETTLSVAWNELKYKAEITKAFGDLPLVICHRGQINQVLMNLLVNAAQAIQKFGKISVRTGVSEDRVWIDIADTGSGIDPMLVNRIFEPFFTTKGVGQGTGLGLALAHHIVRQHGGEIKVTSEPEVGSCFTVWLPIAGPSGVSSERSNNEKQ